MAALISSVYLLAGLVLGATRPAIALAMLVGVVATTPSLPWQLGYANLSYPLFYILGMLSGEGLRRLWTRPSEVLVYRRSTCVTALAMLTLLVAATVNLAARVPLTSLAIPIGLTAALGDVATINPAGLAGMLQAVLVPLAGLLLFGMARRTLAYPQARVWFRRAFLVGCAITAAAVPLQRAFLDPSVRPDQASSGSTGLSGWFQDPHSFAAYLVLAIGFLLGAAVEHRRGTADRAARVDWRLATVIAMWLFGVLLFTNSRSGLAAALVCIGVFLLAVWILGKPGLSPTRQRVRLGGAVATLVALSIAGTTLVAYPTIRGTAYRELSRLGNARMWEPLRPDRPEQPLLPYRRLLWDSAIRLMAVDPLLGVGPNQYRTSVTLFPQETRARLESKWGDEWAHRAISWVEDSNENAHNYYLQYGAEFGLPALASFIALLLLVIGATARHALRRGPGTRGLVSGIVAGELGFLVMCLVSHPLLLVELQALFWCLAAFGLANTQPLSRRA